MEVRAHWPRPTVSWSESAGSPGGTTSGARLQGDHVEHWLNGVNVVEASIGPADFTPKLEHRTQRRGRDWVRFAANPVADAPGLGGRGGARCGGGQANWGCGDAREGAARRGVRAAMSSLWAL